MVLSFSKMELGKGKGKYKFEWDYISNLDIEVYLL